MRVKIKIPKKAVVGFLTFLAAAGIFYGVFRLTTATRATSAGDRLLVQSGNGSRIEYTSWSTRKYNIHGADSGGSSTGLITSRGMCLQASADSPIGAYGYAAIGTSSNSTYKQVIQDMLVFDQTYSSSISSAFLSAYATDVSTALSALGLSGTSDDNLFVLGHVTASYAYTGSHYGLTQAGQSAVAQLQNDVNSYFSSSSEASSWNLVIFNPDTSVQAVGWLEANGSTPTPTTETGTIKLFKYDSTIGATSSGALSGATVIVYKQGSSTTLATLTTGSDGYTSTYESDEGDTICFQETSAPSGYDLNSNPVCGTIVANDTQIVSLANTPTVKGGVKIRKVDADNGSSSNGENSIVGSIFGVYQSGTGTLMTQITINTDLGTGGATGTTASDALSAGTYYVREISATTGYITDTTVPSWTFTIDSSHQGIQDYTGDAYVFENQVKKGDIEITKYKELKFNEVGADTTLAGVSFDIKRQGSSTTVTTITTDDNGYAATTGDALVYGTYNIYEVSDSANEAYDVSTSAIATVTVGETDGATVTVPAVTNELKDDPTLSTEARNAKASARSDDGATEIEISTSASITDKVSFSGLTAGLLYKLEGELWVLDNTYSDPLATATKTWVHGTETYVDVAFTGVDTSELSGKALSIYQELYVCNGHSGTTCTGEWIKLYEHNGDLDNPDADESVTVKSLGIMTSASSERTGKEKYLTAGRSTIVDTIMLDGLVHGTTYYVQGQVVDENGMPIELLNGDSGDSYVRTETYNMTGTTGIRQTTTMELEIDASEYLGTSLTVYETLYDEEMNELVYHRTLGDTDQTLTVEVPTIDTTAVNGTVTSSKILYVSKTATIQDTITLDGLTPNTTYSLASEVYVVETVDGVRTRGERVLGPITTNHGFTTGESEAYTKTVTLTLDTLDLMGEELVVYEYLYYGSQTLAEHTDPTDEDQIVTVGTMEIGTTAKDGADGETDNVIEPETEQIIIDTVTYTGLTPGETYYLEGVLMRKTSDTTGEELTIDGSTVVETATVTPTTASGSVEIEFTLDASELPGEELVVYETLYQVFDGAQKTLAEHKDITDGNQTIKVRPKIGTKAVDEYDGDQIVGVGNVTIVDTVAYSGLKTGINYTMNGYLVLVDGTDVTEIEGATASVSFAIGEEGTEEADGEVTLEFELDTREYTGKKIVVFEELTYTPESGTIDDALITEHKDPTDADQTVTVATPTIQTTAKDKLDGDKEMEMNSVVIVVDEVAYAGLVPGTTYVLRGELRNKENGEIFTLQDGTETEPAYLEFTPDRDAGTVEVEFEFDSTGLSGKELVVFEELYMMELPEDEEETEEETEVAFNEEDLIAKHQDLEDYAQTVWVRIVKPNTGAVTRGLDGAKARGAYAALGGILLVSLGTLVIIRARKKTKFGF